jgi:hypothetical protein
MHQPRCRTRATPDAVVSTSGASLQVSSGRAPMLGSPFPRSRRLMHPVSETGCLQGCRSGQQCRTAGAACVSLESRRRNGRCETGPEIRGTALELGGDRTSSREAWCIVRWKAPAAGLRGGVRLLGPAHGCGERAPQREGASPRRGCGTRCRSGRTRLPTLEVRASSASTST